jgi:hypothetical protein
MMTRFVGVKSFLRENSQFYPLMPGVHRKALCA